MHVDITEEAEQDLDTIFDFIAQDSIHYAHIVIAEIRMIFRYFEINPRMGHLIKESPEIREYVGPYKYIIRYKITANNLFITMVYKWQDRPY